MFPYHLQFECGKLEVSTNITQKCVHGLLLTVEKPMEKPWKTMEKLTGTDPNLCNFWPSMASHGPHDRHVRRRKGGELPRRLPDALLQVATVGMPMWVGAIGDWGRIVCSVDAIYVIIILCHYKKDEV